MKNRECNQVDELVEAMVGIRAEYMEEADHMLRHGRKGQGRKRLAVLLAAAAVLIVGIGISVGMIIRNYTRKPSVSADPDTLSERAGLTVSEDTEEETEEETEAASSEKKRGQGDSEICNLMPPQIAGNSETLIYTKAFRQSGNSMVLLLMAADRSTGISAPVCSRKDCSHESKSCDAFLMNGNSAISALSVSEDRVYFTKGAGSAIGQTAYSIKLPAESPEEAAAVETEGLFPEDISPMKAYSVFPEGQDCFYDGDFYFTTCMGNGKSSAAETVYYPTVVRSPISSEREKKTVFQEKRTGCDYIDLYLMPRDEGLYIIEILIKQGETLGEGYEAGDSQGQVSIYLYHPDTDRKETVFSEEYPVNFGIKNANIHEGKLYFNATDSLGEQCIYVQDLKGKQEVLLKVRQDTETEYASVCFTEDYICIWYQDRSSGELMVKIEVYSYEGTGIRNFSVDKPDELKPKEPEKYLREDGSVSGGTIFLGGDSDALYFRDQFYSPNPGNSSYEEFVYAVSADETRALPFVEKEAEITRSETEAVSDDGKEPETAQYEREGAVKEAEDTVTGYYQALMAAYLGDDSSLVEPYLDLSEPQSQNVLTALDGISFSHQYLMEEYGQEDVRAAVPYEITFDSIEVKEHTSEVRITMHLAAHETDAPFLLEGTEVFYLKRLDGRWKISRHDWNGINGFELFTDEIYQFDKEQRKKLMDEMMRWPMQ